MLGKIDYVGQDRTIIQGIHNLHKKTPSLHEF